MAGVAWADGEPSRRLPYLRVEQVPHPGTYSYRLLGPMLPVWTHWQLTGADGSPKGHSVPCLDPRSECPRCRLGKHRSRYWYGPTERWIGGQGEQGGWHRTILVLPDDTVSQAGKTPLVRATCLCLTREHQKKGVITLAFPPKPFAGEPAEWFDVVPYLLRMWDRYLPPDLGAKPAIEPTPGGIAGETHHPHPDAQKAQEGQQAE